MSPGGNPRLARLAAFRPSMPGMLSQEIVEARHYMVALVRLQQRLSREPDLLVQRCAACMRIFPIDKIPQRRFCSDRCNTYWHREQERMRRDDAVA